jgi:hypothetical protein
VQIPFDQGAPAPLRQFLSHHTISTAYERGGSTLKNGELLQAAEGAGFTVFATTDNLKYQHNLGARRIAIVVLSTMSWPRIRLGHRTGGAGHRWRAAPGSYTEVNIP